MHVDVERSKKSPYGTTIVQGFLMMSLVIHLTHASGIEPAGTAYGLNYGYGSRAFHLGGAGRFPGTHACDTG